MVSLKIKVAILEMYTELLFPANILISSLFADIFSIVRMQESSFQKHNIVNINS